MAADNLEEVKKKSIAAVVKFTGQEGLLETDGPDNEEGPEEQEQQEEEEKSSAQEEAEDWISQLSADDAESETNFREILPTADNLVTSWMLHLLVGGGNV